MVEQALDWDDVGIVIRTVPGARDLMARDLMARVMSFSGNVVMSEHRAGRTVPESYADALAAWSSRQPSVHWVLQLEDDAVLAPDFEEHALRLLCTAAADDRAGVVSYYSGRRVGNHALPDTPELDRLPGSKFLMAQAISIRAGRIEDHNRFMLEFTMDRPYATDTATAAWMQARGLRLYRAWPSIVQHADVPSLSGHRRNPNRFSQSYESRYGRADS